MKNPYGNTLVVGGVVGTILQLLGIIRLLMAHSTELDLFWAVTWFSVGTLIWMATLESFSLANRRSCLWSLLAPLGALTAGILLSQRARGGLISQKSIAARRRPLYQRVAGLLLVAAVTVGFVWAGSQWFRRDQWPPRPSERALRANEATTVARLRELVEAQRMYRESDWEGDGQKQYAPFLVHLWRSVDTSGSPIEVHLLPRLFAMAMSPAWAVDGYYFTDLRRHQLPVSSAGTDSTTPPSAGTPDYADIDLRHGWAVCASPAAYGETGFATFIVDQTGKVWGKDIKTLQNFFPNEPKRSGWVEIVDQDALEGLQDSIAYKP